MKDKNIDKLKKAIIYVDRMANGHNPVNNVILEEKSELNDPNVIRCMYYIKDILINVYNNGGVVSKNTKVFEEPFNYEVLNKFEYIEDKSMTNLFKQINALRENENIEKLKIKPVLEYLKENEYIQKEKIEDFPNEVSIVTDKGKNIGMYNEMRTYNGRTYLAVMYDKNAQEFIIKNLKNIIEE